MSDKADEQSGLSWSAKPGCFERQLQRQYKNCLLPTELQVVTQTQVDDARLRDNEEATSFRADLIGLASSVVVARKNPETTLLSLFHMLKQLHNLQIRAIQLGGDLTREEADLLLLRDQLENDILEMAPDQITRLHEIRRFHETRQEIRSRFAAQVTRPDSPITADRMIPALLAEDVETIRAFAAVMEGQTEQYIPRSVDKEGVLATKLHMECERSRTALVGIQRAALDLVLRLVAREEDAPGIADKLIALGVGQKRGSADFVPFKVCGS
jgi:hypothetical protein